MIGHWTQSLLPQEAHTASSQLGNPNLQAQHHCANSIALLPKVALRAQAGERSREGGTLCPLSDLLDLSSRTFPKAEIVSLHFQLPTNKKITWELPHCRPTHLLFESPLTATGRISIPPAWAEAWCVHLKFTFHLWSQAQPCTFVFGETLQRSAVLVSPFQVSQVESASTGEWNPH